MEFLAGMVNSYEQADKGSGSFCLVIDYIHVTPKQQSKMDASTPSVTHPATWANGKKKTGTLIALTASPGKYIHVIYLPLQRTCSHVHIQMQEV